MERAPLAELDRILSRNELRPEEQEKRDSVLLPLEEALASVSTPPPATSESAASRVALCLWSKTHPESANIELLLTFAGDSEPLVRFCALEALSRIFAAQKTAIHPRLLYRVQEAIRERSRAEESVVVLYTVKRFANEIQQISERQSKPTPRAIANPYVAGIPVRGKRFFGRESILKEISDSLSTTRLKSLILQGPRRTGKTSLLYQIRDGALGDGFVPVYVDMQTLAGTPLSTLLRSWMRSVETEVSKRRPDANLPAMDEYNVGCLREFLSAAVGAIRPASLLLLIDEYEVLQAHLQDRDAAIQLKAMIEDERHLVCIFAGTQKLEAMGDGNLPLLLEIGKIIRVGALKPDEAFALITQQAKGVFEYEENVPKRAMELSACHPFYTQLLCQGLVDVVREAKRPATANDLETVVSRFIENPSPHVLLGWKTLGWREKVVAAAGAELESKKTKAFTPKDVAAYLRGEEYPVRLGTGEVQQVLRTLTEDDWIKKEQGAQAYRYTIELVRRWVNEYRSIWDLLEDQRPAEADLAGVWQQKAAWLIDASICVAVGFLARSLGLERISAAFATMPLVAIYLVAGPVVARTTLGTAALRMKLRRSSGLPLGRWRGALYGILLVLRASAWLLAVSAVGNWIRELVALEEAMAVLGVAAAVEALDGLMIRHGRRRQGLFLKLAGANLIRQSER